MRNRNTQLNIRLTNAEAKALDRYSQCTGLSKSGYIRMLINGYKPKEIPPKEYYKTIEIMTDVHAKLVAGNHFNVAEEIQKALLMLQAEVTLPERRE